MCVHYWICGMKTNDETPMFCTRCGETKTVVTSFRRLPMTPNADMEWIRDWNDRLHIAKVASGWFMPSSE